MSTPENDSSRRPADDDGQVTSERAQTIARRAFLRKSVGVAAPVVMTLHAGPARAVTSITCQHKTPVDNEVFTRTHPSTGQALHPLSGFTDKDTLDGKASNGAIDELVESDSVNFDAIPATTPNDPTFFNETDQRLTANDGFVRCTDTGVTFDGINDPWTSSGGGANPFTFNGPDGDLVDPVNDTGPVAMFTINADGEDVFVGCYGSTAANNEPDAKPLTCSCWSSLHPGP